METRSPFQNDLIVDPGQSAVLHESNTLSKRAKFNTNDIGLSFEWMLSVPSPIDETITSKDAMQNQLFWQQCHFLILKITIVQAL